MNTKTVVRYAGAPAAKLVLSRGTEKKTIIMPGDGRLAIRELEKALQEGAPMEWAAFYPRVYSHISGYTSPKIISSMLALSLINSRRIPIPQAPNADRLLYSAYGPLIEKRMPMFFLSPAFLQAVRLTDFRDPIDWTTLNLPFESGILALPKNGLMHHVDGQVDFIIWDRNKAGRIPPPMPGYDSLNLVGSGGFSIIALCWREGNPIWYDSHLSADHRKVLRLNNLFMRNEGEPVASYAAYGAPQTPFDKELGVEDEPFVEALGCTVFGTFLAMNARPNLLQPSRLINRVQKKDHPVREFWEPNIIGRHFVMRREPLGGTHASPRMHFRRGHYREQAYGTGNTLRKTIWLEPVMVGGG